jgi:four helix bundle protein
MRNYQSLDAWKTSMKLVRLIYQVTKKFPKEETYGLTSQVRRAAVSVPSNIAEGMGRQHKKDTIHFLHIARGSLYEVETLVNIALMNNIVTQSEFNEILNLIENNSRLLNGLINYFEKSKLQ